ncbi:hypothetical protein WUBG_10455 [Wuchereria bancrofti]|uniref:ShKT domain-containing protein n=1 Tax=Wuchereria bancrofti TaxID=6293 RepID=J9ENN9_WUCBA|nr:hypothetical protein WUBG_10455 [Wuchereria bancrofti]VDM10056.1 unnamed protein product [Wuchereria bancrofti]
MFSTFTVVLAYIVLIVGKGEAFEDDYGKRFLQYLTVIYIKNGSEMKHIECVDEEVGDVNCTKIKLEGKCSPETVFETDAIFCQKTCDLCDVDIDIDTDSGRNRPTFEE